MGAEKLTPPGFDPRTVQPVASRYTDCALPAKDLTKTIRLKKDQVGLSTGFRWHSHHWTCPERHRQPIQYRLIPTVVSQKVGLYLNSTIVEGRVKTPTKLNKTVAQLAEALRYKSEGRSFDSSLI